MPASVYKLNHMDRIDWNGVEARDFRDPLVKEDKQAEFLVYEAFPWFLVRPIGTYNRMMAAQAIQPLHGPEQQPLVSVQAEWYY